MLVVWAYVQSNPAISNSANSKSPLFRRKIKFPWIYPFPLRFTSYFETPLFRTFFYFPWDFEIAGFDCISVALYVPMFVARASKVEGTMSWCLRTNEILASIKHSIAKGRTRVLWDHHLDSSQFFRLLLWLQARSITLNIFMIQMLYSDTSV